MRSRILLLLAALLLGVLRNLAHEGVEIGPNGGRVVEFGKDAPVLGEVVLKDGRFSVVLLDAARKPVDLKEQSLTVAGGDRARPEKPAVTREGQRFFFPALKGDEYELVLRLKERPDAKPMTVRFTYDAAVCGACKNPEWLCKCGSEPKAGAKPKAK